jgi:hypothetical protein
MSSVLNAKVIDDYIIQIEETTECSALEAVVRDHLDTLKKLIQSNARQQAAIIKKFFPIASPPNPTPFAIVSWIKKFISGTVSPQLEAHVKLVVQAVELIGALTRLKSAVLIVEERVKACAVDITTNFIVDTVGELINEATGSLTTSLQEINNIQNVLEEVLGEALTTRIDTTNLPSFLQDPLEKLNEIQQQLNTFIDTPVIPQEVFSGSVEIAPGVNLVIQDGAVINVSVS